MSRTVEPSRTRATVRRFQEMKREGRKIVALAACDALFARLLENARVDLILVGDSLGRWCWAASPPFPSGWTR